MVDYEGAIVEYLDGDAAKAAYVTGASRGKLQAEDPQGKTIRLTPKQVVVLHGKSKPSRWKDEWRALEARIADELESVETELLWESLLDTAATECDLEQLVRLYFGKIETIGKSLLFRALLNDTLHFRRKGTYFVPRTADYVHQAQETARKQEDKIAFLERATAWMSEVATREGALPVPAEMEAVVLDIEAFLFHGVQSDVSFQLDQIANQGSRHERAFRILRNTNRLDADADPILICAGVVAQFEPEVVDAAAALIPYATDVSRRDYVALETITIDDDTTRELDDAVSLMMLPDGFRVVVHIADVTCYLGWGGVLDTEAYRRGLSVYLPHRTVTMLPEHIACDLASLRVGEIRPTVSVELDFDTESRLVRTDLKRGQIIVKHRLSYDEVDGCLQMLGVDPDLDSDSSSDALPARMLVILDQVARALRQKRLRNGALVINRPELKVQVDGEQITVKVLNPDTWSRRIVSELMILANSCAAEYASQHQIPLIYRVMDQPHIESERQSAEYDPTQVDRILRRSPRSRFSMHPQQHGGLGVERYARFTSPIRRYADLAIQRQIASHLAGVEPIDGDKLLEVLATSEEAEVRFGKLETATKRRYVLEYLKKNTPDEPLDAIVTSVSDSGCEAELGELYTRGDLLPEYRLALGERIRVAIDTVNPEANLLRFRRVP